MAGELADADRRRMTGAGLVPLTAPGDVPLVDHGWTGVDPVLLPMRLDLAALRAADEVPPLFRGLARGRARRTVAAALPQRPFAELPVAEREEKALALVRGEIATVLGLGAQEAVDPRRPLQDLGFDSLTAVELRNRLNAATGLRLPATLVYDHPTAEELAGHLLAELVPDAERSVLEELDDLAGRLATATPDGVTQAKVTVRLQSMLAQWSGAHESSLEETVRHDFEAASDEEIFKLIHEELGRPES
jgi:acyl carrier protein